MEEFLAILNKGLYVDDNASRLIGWLTGEIKRNKYHRVPLYLVQAIITDAQHYWLDDQQAVQTKVLALVEGTLIKPIEDVITSLNDPPESLIPKLDALIVAYFTLHEQQLPSSPSDRLQ